MSPFTGNLKRTVALRDLNSPEKRVRGPGGGRPLQLVPVEAVCYTQPPCDQAPQLEGVETAFTTIIIQNYEQGTT